MDSPHVSAAAAAATVLQSVWLRDMERTTGEAAQIQRTMLQRILKNNATTEYLTRHRLHEHADLMDGFRKLPFVEYKDIEEYVVRIADGETAPVLCSDPFCGFFISSGTSNGKSKLIPMTKASMDRAHSQAFKINMEETYLAFWLASKQYLTKGGLKAGTLTASGLNSDMFKQKTKAFVSPLEVYLATSTYQCTYCHLICGLFNSDRVTVITSSFAYMITEAFWLLEQVWPEIVKDVLTGSLSSKIVDIELRNAVSKVLRPDAELASKITLACCNFDGIAERLWPNAKFIMAVTTGAMEPYVPLLRGYAGNLKIVSGNYFSSESLIGINLNPDSSPENVTFTVNPEFAYFEFLPFDEHGAHEDLSVPLTDVEVGGIYELAVTTQAGLYRYKLGDVVQVTSFMNSSPNITFLFRNKVILSIATDKTDESELQRAVHRACAPLLAATEARLADFTSHADFTSRPAHYTVFIELRSAAPAATAATTDATLQDCSDALDASFGLPYTRGRCAGSIGPLELCLVAAGTFAQAMELSVARGASASQYKARRCTEDPHMVALLRSRTLHSALSRRDFQHAILDKFEI